MSPLASVTIAAVLVTSAITLPAGGLHPHASAARAQAGATGRLTGTITDPAGAPLAGITLVISGPALSEPRRVVTDADGRFEAARIPAGVVSVTCIAPGFVQWQREGVEVTSDMPVTLDVVMRPLRVQPPPNSETPPRAGAEPPPPMPSPQPSPQPSPASGPSPAELLDQIDSFLGQLPEGSIAFNAPQTMQAGETVEMRLVLSPQLSVEALQERLQGLPGAVQGATLRVAPRMEAVLTGQNFDIAAITPALQAVARNEPTEWRWEVSPRSAGVHRLHLVLNAQVDGTSRVLRTFDRTIEVEVTWARRVASFAQGNWQWLWTTALVPVAGWIWRRRQTRRAGAERTPAAH